MSFLSIALAMPVFVSAFLYNPVPNVDFWDSAKLQKRGISAQLWQPHLRHEHPSLEWVKVTFDCTHIPVKCQNVIMTFSVVSNNKLVTGCRAEGNTARDKSLSLIFAVEPEKWARSSWRVELWQKTANGGKEVAFGYSLSMKRIMELAKEGKAAIAK